MSLFYDAHLKQLGPMLRGHVLLYERREGPTYAGWTGLRLLSVFVMLEWLIGPRMEGFTALGVEAPTAGVRTLILFAALLATAKLIAGSKWTDIGFIPLTQWRAAEWAYLAQVFIAAAAIFFVLFAARLGSVGSAAWTTLGGYLATQMLWGLYQEAIYRGVLQTELTRRFGGIAGALLANLAFTFGPLHFYHLRDSHDPVATAILFASIFVIGLIFAYIFARARNVWLIGLLHGVGDAFGNIGHALSP